MENQIDSITGLWNYRDLPANVRIGQNCWLERKESFARFRSKKDPGLIIGDNTRIYTWTTFNIGPSGLVEVGNDSVLVGPIFMCDEYIKVGSQVVISYNVTVADSDFHPIDPNLRKMDAIANRPDADGSERPEINKKPVIIEDNVWIGIGAIILKGVTIRSGARVGPGAVITGDVPPGAEIIGNPARQVFNNGQ